MSGGSLGVSPLGEAKGTTLTAGDSRDNGPARAPYKEDLEEEEEEVVSSEVEEEEEEEWTERSEHRSRRASRTRGRGKRGAAKKNTEFDDIYEDSTKKRQRVAKKTNTGELTN